MMRRSLRARARAWATQSTLQLARPTAPRVLAATPDRSTIGRA
jgi:hypothetical protein